MAYTASSIRTTAMRWPSTSNRRAPPSISSSSAHNFTSTVSPMPALPIELGGDPGAQRVDEPGNRNPLHDLVEEAGDDQPLRDLRWHPSTLQVEPLFLVDRADR